MDAFTTGARFYEAFSNPCGRLEREGPLLLRLFKASENKCVLDLACGTGIHAHYLAEHGATVCACDCSPEMIAIAGENRPHANIDYQIRDMREPLGGPYGLILCIGNSLSLLKNDTDLKAALARVHDALAPDGHFFLQILNYASPTHQQARCRVEDQHVGKARVVAVKCLAPRDNQTYLTLNYFIHDGEETETLSESTILQNRSRDTITEALETAGFNDLKTFGTFDEQPYDEARSGDLLIVARKKSATVT